MSHLLFVAHDAGGTVPPVLAVANALVEAGHQVTIMSQESVSARAHDVGAAFEAFTDIADYATNRPIEEQLQTALPLLVEDLPARQARDVADALGADVVVIDPNLAGVLAAFEAPACSMVMTWSCRPPRRCSIPSR